MKNLFLSIITLFTISLSAQTVAFNPKTGDVDMDNVLKDINEKAKKDIAVFKDEINKKFNVAENKVDDLLKIMEPGDVFMTAQTAEITNKPVEDVAKAFEKNKGKGWGATAKALGIKPGSKEFHDLKGKMKENHGKGKGKNHGKGGKKDDDNTETEHGKKEEKGKSKGKSKSKN